MDKDKHLQQNLAKNGLCVRGGFLLNPQDGFDTNWHSLLLIGHIGSGFWPFFQTWLGAQAIKPDNPIDSWSKSVLSDMAVQYDAKALFPFERPFYPFQKWALRGNKGLSLSPLRILIDNEHGLYHAFRGALVIDWEYHLAEFQLEKPAPCQACVDKPCLTHCPVNAVTQEDGIDDKQCKTHLKTQDNHCMQQGCLARKACPIAPHNHYQLDHMQQLMQAIL